MIRVLQFADLVNRHDFIDVIVQRADSRRFELGVCVRTPWCNIASPVYSKDTPRWILDGLSRREVPRAVWQLGGILRKWKADIVHCHHYEQAVIGWLATRMYARTRLVVGRHYSDAIYRSSAGLKRKTLLAVEQTINRAAARIIVPSDYIREILTRWQRVRPNKVEKIPYGFVPEKYAPPPPDQVQRLRQEFRMEGRFVLGNFSRLHEEKGQRFLIEAVAALRARHPRLALLIVGEGPERPALEHLIRDEGLGETICLLGWRQDAMTLMAAIDAVVQPTLQEAFSQVMVEALWMGKPLVITDVSGAPDIIADGRNGLLVPKGDAAALAAAIDRLAGDRDLGGRLGIAGRAYVETYLEVSRIIPKYEDAYLHAMGARSGGE